MVGRIGISWPGSEVPATADGRLVSFSSREWAYERFSGIAQGKELSRNQSRGERTREVSGVYVAELGKKVG